MRPLLALDAVVNLLLGVLLLWLPESLLRFLGLPEPEPAFYAHLLGAVLVGIGLALLWEVRRAAQDAAGLGLAGAVVINFCGGSVLALLLLLGDLPLTGAGRALLWLLVVLLVGLSAAEALASRSP